MMKNSVCFICLLVAVFLGCVRCDAAGLPTQYTPKPARQPTYFVIKNVNVIPMTSPNQVIEQATVVIKNGHIESLHGTITKNAQIIDGTGKWLMPGLIDVHVHPPTDFSLHPGMPTQPPSVTFNTQDLMTPFITNGVTTIVNLNANIEAFCQRKEVQKGCVLGPRMAMAALINGGVGPGRRANTAEEGRQAVQDAKNEGYELIKLYSQLSAETFVAIIDEAAKVGLKTVGHIPNAFQGKLEQAFVPHFDLVAHAEEFSKHAKDFSEQEAQRFAGLAKQNGTWLSPTLIAIVRIAEQVRSLDSLKDRSTLQYVHPLLQSKWLTANSYNRNSSPERIAYFEKLVRFHIQLVRAFKALGVPIVAGTDAVLASATRLPATWLGMASEVGTVEVGKLADLVLLDANPLADVNNTRQIAGVFVNGRWLAKAQLRRMLAEQSKRNAAGKGLFNWQQLSRPLKND